MIMMIVILVTMKMRMVTMNDLLLILNCMIRLGWDSVYYNKSIHLVRCFVKLQYMDL